MIMRKEKVPPSAFAMEALYYKAEWDYFLTGTFLMLCFLEDCFKVIM